MWTRTRKVTVGGLAVVALAAGGAGVAVARAQGGGAPAAATATATPGATPTGSATHASGKARRNPTDARAVAKQVFGNLKDFQHAEWVTKGSANTYVSHQAIRGQVTAISSSSITVVSADGTSMTFTVNAQTRVREPQPKGATGSPTTAAAPTLADVKAGQTVLVAGVASPDRVATMVVASPA